MKKKLGVLSVAAFAAVWFGVGQPESPCAQPPPGGGVTCCCHTGNGLCCADVAFCGGYIPGCFCR